MSWILDTYLHPCYSKNPEDIFSLGLFSLSSFFRLTQCEDLGPSPALRNYYFLISWNMCSYPHRLFSSSVILVVRYCSSPSSTPLRGNDLADIGGPLPLCPESLVENNQDASVSSTEKQHDTSQAVPSKITYTTRERPWLQSHMNVPSLHLHETLGDVPSRPQH